ncbi:2-hydroxyacid dehydrogenase [Paraglaciecola hydrolytica]|uniref:Hydroxyacid dehydrogenase n=1 Tax=Paraglaciecola hydrolytica TaxID=1799789 RepID=A0A136A6H3_9ALTE|nr:2-hydroxyacid dehydrogenase [Paraglaciecola hydrolytica]KXI30823.1 hydroxyacid dehydrogenase [Paraglaciecola hydrolytica]
MRIAIFSSKSYDREFLTKYNHFDELELHFFDASLQPETMALAYDFDAVCVFVNDTLNETVLTALSENGVKHIALRCAGFNNVDLACAKKLGLTVSRVPAYSPEAVAEHTIALIMTLNRKLHKAYNRVRENNFSLSGLMGFNLNGKTVGVIGTGKIGRCFINILHGFGCKVLCYDPYPNQSVIEQGAHYVELDALLKASDIISLHCPLSQQNQHMINQTSIAKMRDKVMLINTSRGGLVDSKAIIAGLKSGKIGSIGLDVYEMESELFFEDHSETIMQDDVFDRLASFPNVLITGHQGFFTQEALQQIAQISLNNLHAVNQGRVIKETFL